MNKSIEIDSSADEVNASIRHRISLSFFLFGYVGYLIWKIISTSMLALPSDSFINTAIHGVLFVSLVLSIAFDVEKMKRASLYWLFLTVAIGVKVCSDAFLLIDLVVLLMSARGYSFKRIAIVSFATISITVILIVLLSVAGAIPDYVFKRGEDIRHCLGFLYTTYLSHYYFNIVTLYIFLRSKKIHYLELSLLLLVNLIIYGLTFSRNSFLLVCVLVALVTVGKIKKKRPRPRATVLNACAEYSWIILFATYLMMSLLYNPSTPVWERINDYSSNRFEQTQASLQKYGVTAFGKEIEWVGNSVELGSDNITRSTANPDGDRNFVDNSLVNILLTKGLISLLLVIAIWSLAGKAAADRGESTTCLIFLLIAVHSSIDPQLTAIEYSSFWFYAMSLAQSELHGRIGVIKKRLAGACDE